MDYYSGYITKLIEELSGLPGIGPKNSRETCFFSYFGYAKEQVESLANSMIDAKKNVRYCKCCYTYRQDICPICSKARNAQDHYGSGNNKGYGCI